MTRRAARVDDNQREVVRALRDAGCTIQYLHHVGGGCPDILVGFREENFLLEIKDGSKPPSQRKLTPSQEDWHRDWKGQKAVVCSEEEALDYVYGKTQGVL